MTDNRAAIGQIADEVLDLMFRTDPIAATLYGIPGYDDKMPDRTEAAEETLRSDVSALLEKARTADGDAVTKAVVIQQLEATRDALDARGVEYTITDSFFAPAPEMLAMLPMTSVESDAQAQAYLTRLTGIPQFLRTIADRHRGGVAAGRTPVAHLVTAAIAHLDRYLSDSSTDPLLRDARDDQFDPELARLVADVVRPAYAEYRQVLANEIGRHGRDAEHPGLCHLPDGDRFYAGMARAHTTTDRTPDELHQTGLDVMARLADEYAALGSSVLGTSDLAVIFDRLRSDPELRWDDGAQLLHAAQDAVTRAETEAPNWFGSLPDQACAVKEVPPAEAPGAPLAYYLPPAMDGSRPGTYFANTDRPTERYRYSSEATAFHEAVPGHHLQLSIAQQLQGLPLLRKLAPVTAYVEGWGLYAERLADEMGLYSDDLSRFGMLTLDSMRAGRLVVDTGLHAKGWSRQQAIDYLSHNTAMSIMEIQSEVDRYIAAPGQALAYMVGKLEIMRLREAARDRLGDRFDLRGFHDLVLGGGPLPLGVLDEVVTAWAA